MGYGSWCLLFSSTSFYFFPAVFSLSLRPSFAQYHIVCIFLLRIYLFSPFSSLDSVLFFFLEYPTIGMYCTLLSESFSILPLKMGNMKGEAFWHELWNDLIEIPLSHPLLTHTCKIQGPSSDGRVYQSSSPAACHESLTLITRIRLVVFASPPATRTSAQP